MNQAIRARDDAANQLERALEVARSLRWPWYRCQALASAARECVDVPTRGRIIDEALEVASFAGDPDLVVTASSWLIKLLVIDGRFERASLEIDRLMTLMATEPNPERRADGLKHLLAATLPGPIEITTNIVEAFAMACVEPMMDGRRNQRGESMLVESLPVIARIDERVALEALRRLPDVPAKVACEQILSMQAGTDDQLAAWQRLSVY